MEWNFSNTIRRGHTQDSAPPTSSEKEEVKREEVKSRVEATRRHTLTESTDSEDGPIRVEIEDTAFVAIGDRSSIVIGERGECSAGGGEVMGDGDNREGGEGGKVCLLQEPERTRGDGQEADSRRLDTPPSSSLQHTILPLLAQVSHMTIT